MDGPSLQLQETLNFAIREALGLRRPTITHLNADTSWLLQLPYPPKALRPPGRSRFSILIDPWFQGNDFRVWSASSVLKQEAGPQSDVARLFSTQWHAINSSVQTMAELEERLKDVEKIAQSCDLYFGNTTHKEYDHEPKKSFIDAVVISHEFTDHCNQHTLVQLDPNTPVFATKLAADLIRSWKYFNVVQEIPGFSANNSDWRNTSLQPLPSWLGISRIVTESDALYYHSAILVTFDQYSTSFREPPEESTPAEAIIYTPHGIHAHRLNHLTSAFPPLKTLALLHGLHDIRISVKQLNLGAHNGLQVQRICQAKYWVSTHDEVKKGTGFITRFLHRNVLTLQEALYEERKAKGEIHNGSKLVDMRDVTFSDLASGESLLLI